MNTNEYLNRIGLGDPENMSSPTPQGMFSILAARQWQRQPVLYKIPSNWIDSLRDTEINIPPDQYNQSYPSIMVQFPDSTLALVSIVNAWSPTHRKPSGEMGRYLEVRYSFGMREEKPGVFTHLGVTVRLDQPGYLVSLDRDAKTIEETVRETEGVEDNEKDGIKNCGRIAINAVLLLAGHPLHRVRTERERELIKKSKHHKRDIAVDAKERLRLLPQVIDFVNPPRIGNSYGTETGITKKAHWRKGHWRAQACGANWEDHKWMFIERTLIHPNQVDGDGDGEITFVGKGDL